MQDEHFRQRDLFDRKLESDDKCIDALPVPVARAFRSVGGRETYPKLGEANREFGVD